jgi:adenosylmethionine-8-amino-7-oxononanoate aminotransferase
MLLKLMDAKKTLQIGVDVVRCATTMRWRPWWWPSWRRRRQEQGVERIYDEIMIGSRIGGLVAATQLAVKLSPNHVSLTTTLRNIYTHEIDEFSLNYQ